jgi:hypothetical protein
MDELLHKLRNGSDVERISAAKSLGESADPNVLPVLKEVLGSLQKPYDKYTETERPGGFMGNSMEPHVYQTEQIDPDRSIREAIETAIKKLEVLSKP